MVAETAVDESLMSGVRAQIGGLVFDGSPKSAFAGTAAPIGELTTFNLIDTSMETNNGTASRRNIPHY